MGINGGWVRDEGECRRNERTTRKEKKKKKNRFSTRFDIWIKRRAKAQGRRRGDDVYGPKVENRFTFSQNVTLRRNGRA
jgi:hypothetical protein